MNDTAYVSRVSLRSPGTTRVFVQPRIILWREYSAEMRYNAELPRIVR